MKVQKLIRLYYSLTVLLALVFLTSCTSELQLGTSDAPKFALDRSSDVLPYVQIRSDAPIQNEPKVGGVISLYERNELSYTGRLGIEYRGSTSYRLSDKKSFGIELWDQADNDLAVELLGMPAEEDWILMGQVFRASTNTIFESEQGHYLAIKYGGYTMEWREKKAANRLREIAKKQGLEISGEPILMIYNSPYQILNRKNEVLYKVIL
jgi:hypothetical protein